MNTLRHRDAIRAPALLAATLLALCAAPLTAQRDDEAGTGGQFSLPRSQDDVAEYREAVADLAANRHEAAVERLVRLWRSASRGVIARVGAVDRWSGIRNHVMRTLRDLDEDGRAACERLAARELGPLASQPVSVLSEADLVWIAGSFPTTERGVDARLRLGDLALERGDALRAQQHFLAADDAMREDDPRRVALGERRQVARLMVRASFDPLDDDSPLSSSVDSAMTSTGDVGWSAFGGGLDGARPMTEPFGEPGASYHVPIAVDGFDLNLFAMHAVGDLGALFLNDGQSMHAIDPVGRRVLWDAPGPMVDRSDVSGFRDGVNADTVLACAVDADVVVAALQVPNDVAGAEQTRQYQNAMTIIQRIPTRRLFAVERATGKRLWAHWDTKDGIVSRRFSGHDACGAPVISGDTVFAPIHDPTGAISYSIAAYDLHSGAPRWRTFVCASQQEVNMFGNSQLEFAAGPIAVHDGVVYGTTNLGIVYAVDAEDGELRWLSAYETIPLPPPQLAQQADRRPVFFANNPLVFADGVIATTPIDSQFALGLDATTGAPLWRMSYVAYEDVTVRWLLGVIDGEFVFSGQGIVAVAPRPKSSRGSSTRAEVRLVASKEAVGEGYYRATAIPRGALSRDRIWQIGSDSTLRILDARGNRDPRMPEMAQLGRGNLLMVDGLIAVTSDGGITTWADPEGLTRVARRRVAQRPGDPQSLLRLARLERARLGDAIVTAAADSVQQLFEKGLAAADARGLGRGSRTRQDLAEGLFEIAFSRALAERRVDPRAALARLRRARDIAWDPRTWMRAQQEILELCSDDAARTRDELDLMARTWPDESFVFRGVGRAKVATYAALARVPVTTDAEEAARLCQHLVERGSEEMIGDRRVRDVAVDALRTLVRERGQAVLVPLEREATAALTAAGNDSLAIRGVAQRYPLTGAARRATALLLDDAVAHGEFDVVLQTYADALASGEVTGAMLRRVIAAALGSGNEGLAAGFARRLIAREPDTVSDFTADGGMKFADALAGLAPPPLPPSTPIQLPSQVLGTIVTPNQQSSWSFQRVERVSGFAPQLPLPLLANVGGQQLFAFDLDPIPDGVQDARFTIQLESSGGQSTLEPVLQCGAVLVVCDLQSVMGIDRQGGKRLWRIEPQKGRWMRMLGAVDGALVVQVADSETNADGALVLAVEPSTGSVLARIDVGEVARGAVPVLSAGLCWLLDCNDPDAVAARAFDPLTGIEVESTPIAASVLAALELTGPSAHRLLPLRKAIFADDRALYLPVETNQVGEPSRIVALRRRTGAVEWSWSGTPGCLLVRVGKREDRVVVFERSTLVARLIFLDERGAVSASFEQAALAATPNWPDSRFGTVPDPIILTDSDSGLRLTCVSLHAGGPRFQLDLSTVQSVRGVLLGPTFMTILSHPRGQAAPIIQVMDLATRRSVLPKGRAKVDIALSRPSDMFALEGYVIVQTLDSLRILGTPK